MSARYAWGGRLGRALVAHLDHLCATLESLSQRLRDAVAQAVGQIIAGAVQDGVRTVLGEAVPPSERGGLSPWSRTPSAPTWDYPEDCGDPDDPDGPWAERGPPAPSTRSPTTPFALATESARWHQAVAVGCEAAAWWLRCQLGRLSAWAAVVVGLTAAAAARLAGARRAAAFLSLLTLADTVHAGATLWAVPASS
jgi:hypothetical protein